MAEFFNRVPNKERKEFLATMRETISAAPKGASYYKPAPYGFPLDSQDKEDNSTKKLQNLTIKPYMKHMPRRKEMVQM